MFSPGPHERPHAQLWLRLETWQENVSGPSPRAHERQGQRVPSETARHRPVLPTAARTDKHGQAR